MSDFTDVAEDRAQGFAMAAKMIGKLLTAWEESQAEIAHLRSGSVDLGYHYWRECHNCGYAGGGYLHCVHDGVQYGCHKCGERMPTVTGECECAFVATIMEVQSALATEAP